MKVYQVVMPYYDGDHEHGYYMSPLFKTKDDAESFLKALSEMNSNDKRKWETCSLDFDLAKIEDKAYIEELEIHEFSDDFEIKEAEHYLHISYT